jgi:uncharacterized DUF497 family protein
MSMKKTITYQIDSFTKKKFKGNPAGVVINADGLNEKQMQLISRELNNWSSPPPRCAGSSYYILNYWRQAAGNLLSVEKRHLVFARIPRGKPGESPTDSSEENKFILLWLSSSINMLLVCHGYRSKDQIIRIISVRKANHHERDQYINKWKNEKRRWFFKTTRNLYAKKIKKPVTIRLDKNTISYFKKFANEIDAQYQTLINIYLRDCAATDRKLSLKRRLAAWSARPTRASSGQCTTQIGLYQRCAVYPVVHRACAVLGGMDIQKGSGDELQTGGTWDERY